MKNKLARQMIKSLTKTPPECMVYYDYYGNVQLGYLHENSGKLYPIHSWVTFGTVSLTGEQMGRGD